MEDRAILAILLLVGVVLYAGIQLALGLSEIKMLSGKPSSKDKERESLK